MQLIDSGETQEGQLYAVFAYVPGETLEQALSREGALGVRESVRLLTQVLEALACAHAKGIVHRDLKPSNLMLSGGPPRRNAVVLDFGLGGLAEGRRRKEWETLTQTRSGTSPIREASARARSKALRVLVGLATSYRDQGDLVTSSELANEPLQAAERTGGAFDLLSAHYAVGVPLSFQGAFSRSLHHLEEAIGLYDFNEHAPLAHTLGRDLGVQSHSWAALCHVRLGHPGRGLAASQEGVVLARRLEHPASLAVALVFAALTHFVRREPVLAQARADEAIALAEELGFLNYGGIARVVRGWARAVTQEGDEGLAEIQQGIAELERIRVRVGLPQFVMGLAEVFWKFGRHEEALGALDLGVARAQERERTPTTSSSIACGPRSSWTRAGVRAKRQETSSAARSRSRRSRRRSGSGCAPPRAWRACSAPRDAATRPARSCGPSTTGSPRASTPPT